MAEKEKCNIIILKDGPYLVSGNVPLEVKSIAQEENDLTYVDVSSLAVGSSYALCRCGHSKNMPFCDGMHSSCGFDGTETASREPYLTQAEVIEGPGIILTDAENLCAYARFCHTDNSSVWELTDNSADSKAREGAIKAACDCPAGRLVAWDKETGEPYEPEYPPSIVLIQDPDENCSGPIWVRGGIPIQSSDGSVYEIRNRVTLCRCGKSSNMPFCDATHVSVEFTDKLNK